MNRIAILITLIAIGCSCSKTPEKPNVLVIIVDDLGWGDVGYNNPEHVYTPNMDEMAAGGVTFTQH